MKILVLGATGKVGRHVVKQALASTAETSSAFMRSPEKLEDADLPKGHAHLRLVQGDVADGDTVLQAAAAQDAIISAVGMTKTSAKDVLAVTAQNVIDSAQRNGVRRIVSLVGAGVEDPRDEPSVGRRMMRGAMKLLVSDMLHDAERHAELLRASDLEWTLVRPPRLSDGEKKGDYRTGYLKLGPREQISRADLAEFMLKLATEGGYEREAPMVSY